MIPELNPNGQSACALVLEIRDLRQARAGGLFARAVSADPVRDRGTL